VTPNTQSTTISVEAPRLLKQALFSDYKHRKWYGNRNANKIPYECWCGARFSTVQARDRHMRNCHDDGDAA
jgi:hypothetical protein